MQAVVDARMDVPLVLGEDSDPLTDERIIDIIGIVFAVDEMRLDTPHALVEDGFGAIRQILLSR